MHKHHGCARLHQMHHSAERVDSFGPSTSARSTSPLRDAQQPDADVVACRPVVTCTCTRRCSSRRSAHEVCTPQCSATSCSAPRATACITGGIHHYNFSDLPLFDLIFGTFRNPKDFVAESGFEASLGADPGHARLRDVAADDFEQSVRPPSARIARVINNKQETPSHESLHSLHRNRAHALACRHRRPHADPLARPGQQTAAAGRRDDLRNGLHQPRGLTFGPDGHLTSRRPRGRRTTAADIDPNCPPSSTFQPFAGGYSVASPRPPRRHHGDVPTTCELTDNTLTSFGPTDVAFVGETLYVLIELGGCSHGLPEDLPAILRVNPDGSTTNVAT